MSLVRAVFLATTMLTTSATLAKADVNVVTSIKPVHSLVAAVMQGVGTPDLLVEGAASPHTYALKPSQAGQLQNADLVFWMSHDLEAFLEKSIESIASGATSVPLMESHGLIKLKEGLSTHTIMMIMAMETTLLNGPVFLTFRQEPINGPLQKWMETMPILR